MYLRDDDDIEFVSFGAALCAPNWRTGGVYCMDGMDVLLPFALYERYFADYLIIMGTIDIPTINNNFFRCNLSKSL